MEPNAFASSGWKFESSRYTDTLLWIAGIEVLFTWTFLVLVGLFPSRAFGALEPISYAFGFAILGLGVLEFGVIVLNVQMIWLLPGDHDESGVVPFLCGYCLLGQVLLMFPPLIVLGILLVPLVLISHASVGWYFQKFTSLKLSQPGRTEHQNPLSIKAILWMPVALLGLGAIPIAITFLCGPYFLQFAFSHSKHLGIVLICSATVMISVSLLPLFACYGFLFLTQCKRASQWIAFGIAAGTSALSVAIEAIASNHTSAIMPLVSLAILMFVFGLWAGLQPWQKEGLQVVFAKPIARPGTLGEVKFDELQ